jgi:hypothetical protein
MRGIFRVAFTGALLGWSALLGLAGQYKWPEVEPLQRSFYFADASKAAVKLLIDGASGKPLYRLECHTGDYEGDPNFNYSGAFDCKLIPLNPDDAYNDLLGPDPLGWEVDNRAAIIAEDLVGRCADYPEHGRVRHFRLRDMKLTFVYSDLHLEKWPPEGPTGIRLPRLLSFRFSVRVEPDPTAVSTIAEPVPFAEPPPIHTADPNIILPNCDKVIRQHVPGVVTQDYIRNEGLPPPYPSVQSTEATATLHMRQEGALRMRILDKAGKLAYSLDCSASIGTAGVDRWGIDCKLFPADKKINMLGDAVDPYSRMNRALILPEQLEGECWRYPEWGAVRRFRLRGFELTLAITTGPLKPTKFHNHRGQEVTLKASVRPDASATSSVAMPSRYTDWSVSDQPNACEHVLVDP